ncbi:MAG: hypothetical protein NZ899_13280 [Thermoguttaceae bacterium]|nr:hypothetical protein [Thermoguttaceae bacterium]MDW8080058.1 hypothetical protein [Thermoguttaceae bacterium]
MSSRVFALRVNVLRVVAFLVVSTWLFASVAFAQRQYIGYVYPAGGQQGTTFPIRLGGQGLSYPTGLIVTGEGVSVRLVDFLRVMSNQELDLLRQQLKELENPEVPMDEPLISRMAFWEFPAPIGPPELVKPFEALGNGDAELPLKERARRNLIRRIQMIFAEDERFPAVRAHCELVFAEVTIAPDAPPGRREIRVLTTQGISNPLPFYVGQVPEVCRKPMKTAQLPVLGREHLAQRKRPPEEEEVRITIPCTMNGQIAPGELNRYRFFAKKGQQLVISVLARELIPYVPDAVPGWLQAVVRVHDAAGREVAYADDYRSNPDPVLFFQVPEDGEYVLTIHDALFRGRESFVYRITIGEMPFLASVFPLGGPAGQPLALETRGFNLEGAELMAPPADAPPGVHLVRVRKGGYVSNPLPVAIDTLPEVRDQEPNNDRSQPQKVTLPVIVNGRIDQPGDWDVFEVEGRAGQTVVVEVLARRLASPMDSLVKVTNEAGEIIALNDDYHDAASGWNTDHADSYLMVKLPADGRYFVHIGDTRRQGGVECAYRLRISPPRPDFALRVMPSRVVIPSKSSVPLTVFVIRRDGFDQPIVLRCLDLPEGVESPGATIQPNQTSVNLAVRTSLAELRTPVNIRVVGTSKVGEEEISRQAVPAEDRMQAFLWRHLLPAEALPLVVFNPSYRPPETRVRPPIRDEDRPKDVPRTTTRASVDWYVRQIEALYQEYLLTDDFTNRQIANIEARIIQ